MHEYHALQELEKREDLDSWEENSLRGIRNQIKSLRQ